MSQHHQVAAVTRPRGACDVDEDPRPAGARCHQRPGHNRIEPAGSSGMYANHFPSGENLAFRAPRFRMRGGPPRAGNSYDVPRRLNRGGKDHSRVVGRERRLRTIALARGELDRCAANLLQPYLRRFAILPGIRDVHDHARVRRQRRPECRRGRPGHVFQTRLAGCLGSFGLVRRRRYGISSPTAFPPCGQLASYGVDAAALCVFEAMDGQSFFALPPLYGANTAPQIRGDFLPRVEPRLVGAWAPDRIAQSSAPLRAIGISASRCA